MFLEERIAIMERQMALLGEEIGRLRADLARFSTEILNDPPRAAPGRPALTTKEAARLLNRAPQTLRVWAMYESGPILPQRINGRLLWATEDIMKLVTHGDQ